MAPGVVLAALLAAGCSGSDDPSAASTAPPTPITELDVTAVRLARVEFCDRVPAAAVRHALGGAVEDEASWGNGDPVPGDAAGDVAHELGCAWTATDGTAARAWVFARPVTADFAGTLVRQAGALEGCTAEAAPVFGSPALLQTCARPDGTQRVRRAGLFGDTWLTCEVTLGPSTADPIGADRIAADGAHRERLDTWCAAVVSVLDGG